MIIFLFNNNIYFWISYLADQLDLQLTGRIWLPPKAAVMNSLNTVLESETFEVFSKHCTRSGFREAS